MRKTQYACDILGEYFATATELRARCRELLDKYACLPCTQADMAENDAAFFVELVRLRDASRIPSGCYVKRAARVWREGHAGRHLLFEYSDGSLDMIGWSKLCGGQPVSATVASNAMRQSIKPQMQEAYVEFFQGHESGTCPKTGVAISAAGGWHGDDAVVHHDGLSFSEIRDAWLLQNGLTLEQIPLKDLWDGGGYEVAPGDLCDSWKRFHRERAVLAVVSATWHREHHKDERKQQLGRTA